MGSTVLVFHVIQVKEEQLLLRHESSFVSAGPSSFLKSQALHPKGAVREKLGKAGVGKFG